ncbi:MAG: PAS domain S-box protein, partial [Desulfobacula sp.]|nr:PAS domain S-box protein [Desulfobacula sp.]
SAFHKMCGYNHGDLIGKSIYDLFSEDADPKVLRDYIKTLIQEQPEPEPWFSKIFKKNGNFLETQTDWNYKFNRHGDVIGFISIISDITERKQAEKKLKEKESHYRHLFNSLPYGGEVIDVEGKVINCSESTLRLLGYEKDEIIGKHITNFFESGTIKIFKENFPKIMKGESLTLEERMIHKNGSRIDVLRSAQPIFNADKKVVGMLTISVDITERKQAEETLRQYEHIISATNDHMSFLDRDYTYLAVNDAYFIANKKEHSQIVGPRVYGC